MAFVVLVACVIVAGLEVFAVLGIGRLRRENAELRESLDRETGALRSEIDEHLGDERAETQRRGEHVDDRLGELRARLEETHRSVQVTEGRTREIDADEAAAWGGDAPRETVVRSYAERRPGAVSAAMSGEPAGRLWALLEGARCLTRGFAQIGPLVVARTEQSLRYGVLDPVMTLVLDPVACMREPERMTPSLFGLDFGRWSTWP
jgi:hypothetical protein